MIWPVAEERDSWGEMSGGRQVGVIVALTVMLGATGGVVYAIYTGSTPTFKNPNFLDAILESRLVLALVRTAVIGACVYVVISIIGHISAGRWLSSVGPVKVGDSVRTVSQEADNLQEQLTAARATIQTLSGQLKKTEDTLGVSNRDRDEVIKDYHRLQRETAGQ